MSAPVDTVTSLSNDVGAYRIALRQALTEDPVFDPWRGAHQGTVEELVADHSALMAELYRTGWNRYGWPVEAGGLGGDERHRGVLYDELAAADLPIPVPHQLMETLGPPVVKFAPHLAAEYFPAYLRGERRWSQGFSEPEAGSDLASLRCRARRDGDTYVINGQKLWTTHAATASRVVCLLRTGTPESRHRGLTMIMVDLDTPGVSVRPIALASGDNELAEVFFDDAVVPASRLIGDEGQGWVVAMYLLQFERAMFAWICAADLLRRLGDLRDQLDAQRAGGRTLPDGAVLRLGACYDSVVTLRGRNAATVRRLAAGENVGPEASVDKVLLASAEIALNDFARDVLGAGFVFGDDAVNARWRHDWWYSRAATIFGGSSEMQRTILADHVLGLPREGRK